MEDEQSTSPSLKNKLKQTLCLSCCFRSNRRDTLDSPSSDDKPRLLRTPSTWLKSRAQELPEIKDKCRHLITRIGKHHRRHSSADFRYDPLSYSLNFDGGYEDTQLDDVPLRNFSSRLPASPPPRRVAVPEVEVASVVGPNSVAVRREITAFS
ncbi:uncharacterized protein LOC132279806 [Cornus florida]|uniref:uncharacterized protein LOC132279806 n=1 Tax=Cornus florida TaxID=4283 RepID=UPI00289B2862|nr:uncharacterized protein LOC132279806 [Cornus florida]